MGHFIMVKSLGKNHTQLVDGFYIIYIYNIYIYQYHYISLSWLVVWTPLKNMSSSVGVIIPKIWKAIKAYKSHVPNHQQLYLYYGNIGESNYQKSSPCWSLKFDLDESWASHVENGWKHQETIEEVPASPAMVLQKARLPDSHLFLVRSCAYQPKQNDTYNSLKNHHGWWIGQINSP